MPRLQLILKLTIALILTCHFPSEISAQKLKWDGKIIPFHPAVGNEVSAAEKKEFGIFTEYNDSLFESAQLIEYDSSKYVVLIRSTRGTSFEREMPVTEKEAIYKRIESIKPFASIVEPGEDDYVVKKEDAGDTPKRKDHSQAWMTALDISLNVLFVFLEILAN